MVYDAVEVRYRCRCSRCSVSGCEECRWSRGGAGAGEKRSGVRGGVTSNTMTTVTCIILITIMGLPYALTGDIRDLEASAGVRSVQLTWTCEGRCGAQMIQYYDSDTRISDRAQPMSVITGETDLLVERLAPSTNYTFIVYDELSPELQETVNATTLAVQLEELRCAPKRIEVSIYTGPVFGGIIYVGGHFGKCRMIGDASRDVDAYRLTIPLDQCANKLPNYQYETTVIVQEHINIATGNDLAMSISCDYTPPKEKRVTSGFLQVTEDPTSANEAIQDIDRMKLIIHPQANREEALSANLNQAHTSEETIEAERIEDRVVFYNIAAVISIAVGICFILLAVGICYCRHKQNKRQQEKQFAAEQSDPKVLLSMGGYGVTTA